MPIALQPVTHSSCQRRKRHHQRKRQFKERDGHKCQHRYCIGKSRRQCASGHSIKSLKDNRQNCSFKPKQKTGDHINMTEGHIKRR
ncbi:hypothetical protein FQZ97_939090 [compost metagenome]